MPVVCTDLQSATGQHQYEFVLEQTSLHHRKTAMVYLPAGEHLPAPANGLEILVLQGSCKHNNNAYNEYHYLRIPGTSPITGGPQGCRLFVKYNQFMAGDTGERIIDTSEKSKWLPGPVDGIRIRPLHVFNTESIMLLHWQRAEEFRPNLDPQGEELLVIKGLLQNKDQLFQPYSWLRNPVEDWRSWHGSTDTLVYYKSGHFPESKELS